MNVGQRAQAHNAEIWRISGRVDDGRAPTLGTLAIRTCPDVCGMP